MTRFCYSKATEEVFSPATKKQKFQISPPPDIKFIAPMKLPKLHQNQLVISLTTDRAGREYSRHTWQVTHDNIYGGDCVLGDLPSVALQCLLQPKQADLLDPFHCYVKDSVLALPRESNFQLHLVTERRTDRVETEVTDQAQLLTSTQDNNKLRKD